MFDTFRPIQHMTDAGGKILKPHFTHHKPPTAPELKYAWKCCIFGKKWIFLQSKVEIFFCAGFYYLYWVGNAFNSLCLTRFDPCNTWLTLGEKFWNHFSLTIGHLQLQSSNMLENAVLLEKSGFSFKIRLKIFFAPAFIIYIGSEMLSIGYVWHVSTHATHGWRWGKNSETTFHSPQATYSSRAQICLRRL